MALHLVWSKRAPKIYAASQIRTMKSERFRITKIRLPYVAQSPHGLYEITMEDLFKPNPTHYVSLTGWRYAMVCHDKNVPLAEVRVIIDGDAHEIIEGDDIACHKLATFLKAAGCECLEEEGKCHPRLLTITDQSLDLVWLKRRKGLSHLYMPLDASRIGLMPGRTYTLTELREALK